MLFRDMVSEASPADTLGVHTGMTLEKGACIHEGALFLFRNDLYQIPMTMS